MSDQATNTDTADAIEALLDRPDLHADTVRLIQLAHKAQTEGTPLEDLVATLPQASDDNDGCGPFLGLLFVGLGLWQIDPSLALVTCGLILIFC